MDGGVISATLVRRSKRERQCAGAVHGTMYLRDTTIASGRAYVRLYGSAHYKEKPWILALCMDCARESGDPKIKRAYREWSDAFESH